LSGSGLVERTEEGWRWNRAAFAPDGTVDARRLRITDPHAANCGQCHGLVHEGREPVTARWGTLDQWSTETKGQIFSAQHIRHSSLNLAGKEDLGRPWDIHAERLFRCSYCHHSLNHPGYYKEFEETKPAHLRFDARRLETGRYLKRPNHHLAKGRSVQGTVMAVLDDTMRRCEDCHDAERGHAFLPYKRRHLNAMLCESCHVPDVPVPARRETDWTVLTPERGPRITHRGAEGPVNDPATLLTGFRPVLLPRAEADGSTRLTPMNLLASWFWVTGPPERPVRLADLERAFFTEEGPYHPEIVRALDADGDGGLSPEERLLDHPAEVEAVRRRLEAVGVPNASIRGEIQPIGIHHGTVAGAWAVRECGECHGPDGRLDETFEIARFAPAGVEATIVGDAGVRLSGEIERKADGSLVLRPEVERYVPGLSRIVWIDGIGLLAVLAAIGGAAAHGILRVRSRRRGRGS
jgi:hypothetical protein